MSGNGQWRSGFDDKKSRIVNDLGGLDTSSDNGNDRGWDKSPKGSLDRLVRELCFDINRSRDMVTTSSCSGRVSLFQDELFAATESLETEALDDTLVSPRKGTGCWLDLNHDRAWNGQEIEAILKKSSNAASDVVFKVEPFVLHVMCRSLESAQLLLRTAIESGFRESGISIGEKKIMVGIRTMSNSLEVPLVHRGQLLMDSKALNSLACIAKNKFEANAVRRNIFHEKVQGLIKRTEIAKIENREGNSDSLVSRSGKCVLVQKRAGKKVKKSLEEAGLYDKSRLAGLYGENDCLAIPVSENISAEALIKLAAEAPSAQLITADLRISKRSPSKRREVNLELTRMARCAKSLQERIFDWICAHVSPDTAVKLKENKKWKDEIPRKIELLDDVALISHEYFRTESLWNPIFVELGNSDESCLWRYISKLVSASRVVLQKPIDSGGTRASRAKLVFPSTHSMDPVKSATVSVKQNGIRYEFDITKVMFSSGNISEKIRVAGFSCHGETVVDLFAGIGYFTLPYLVHTGCEYLHACEWNPDSLEALRNNLSLNGISPQKYTIHAGDCRATVIKSLCGVADRVNLGIIPSSKPFLESALRALKPATGGWLHIHENVPRNQQAAWIKKLEATLCNIIENIYPGEKWLVSCKHVERVKSYSPRVEHIVADTLCIPTPASKKSDNEEGLLSGNDSKNEMSSNSSVSPSHNPLRCIQKAPFPTSREDFEKIMGSHVPLILKNALPEERLPYWSISSLATLCEGDESIGSKVVSVHIADSESNGKLSFVNKNFTFCSMKFKELLQSLDGDKRLYMRAVGSNPRKDRAHLWKDFATLTKHTGFDSLESLIPEQSYFSSVLRVASRQLQLWTHYDVMDNILVQCSGRKRLVLFPPECVDALDMKNCTSSIVDIDDPILLSDNETMFSKARKQAIEVELSPGDALFIPALWPHSALTKEPSIAVNIFWKGLSTAHYGTKDLYGNRDPLLAERALQLVEQAKDVLHSPQNDGTVLPTQYIEFYSRLAAANLLS